MGEIILSGKARLDWAALSLFLAVFATYAYCAYPTIAPRDSADMAAAAITLGVAHPPGYPLYSLLGKAWCAALGLGDLAYRLNLMSAFFGALAAAVVFRFLRARAGLAPALGAAWALAFGAPLWKFSLLEEMYSLHALIAAGLLALSRGETSSVLRRFYASCLLFGLGLVNHQTMVFMAPCLALLWREELRRGKISRFWFFKAGLGFFLLGLAPQALVWIRLKDASSAWAVLSRAEYGSLTLSGQFSRALSPELAGGLLAHLALGLAEAVSWPAALAAAAGVLVLFKRDRRLGLGLLLAFLGFGPLFFLMTRFDVSGWVARSVLETAFIVPSVLLCVAAGFGLARLGRAAAFLAAAALAAAGLAAHAAQMSHRDDFAAYDYAKDIRRAVAPGAAAVVAGDTAQFALRYLELAHPGPGPRRVILSALEDGKRRWIDEQLRERPVCAVGLPLEMIAELRFPLAGLGLASRVGGPWRLDAWEFSARRSSRAGERGEAYARDVTYSYAYAHYLSGWLAERGGLPEPVVSREYRNAFLLEPETYQIARVPVEKDAKDLK